MPCYTLRLGPLQVGSIFGRDVGQMMCDDFQILVLNGFDLIFCSFTQWADQKWFYYIYIYMVLPKELLRFVFCSHDSNIESFRTDSRGLGARDNGPRQTHR